MPSSQLPVPNLKALFCWQTARKEELVFGQMIKIGFLPPVTYKDGRELIAWYRVI